PPRITCFQRGLTAMCAKVEGSYWRIERIQFENAYRGIDFFAPVLGCTDIEVNNCYFKCMENRTYTNSVGLEFEQNGWNNVSIMGCTFDHVSNGIEVQTGNNCTNFNVDDCEAFGGWWAGVALANVASGTVTRMRVHDVGDANPIGATGMLLVSCANVVVSDCSIWN